jgi:hypothetical protein
VEQEQALKGLLNEQEERGRAVAEERLKAAQDKFEQRVRWRLLLLLLL